MTRPNHPYAHAARLPEGDTVNLQELIVGSGPFELEIGPGRGGFVFERCEAAPEVRFLGLEVRLKWASIVDERLKKQGFGTRARVLCEDARVGLTRLTPDAFVQTMFVHFPDPWWKKRHEKRLVLGEPFIESALRLLKDGGELFVQTDVDDRAERYAKLFERHPDLVPYGDEPGSPALSENPYGARSPREHRAIEDGLPVYRLRYRRKPR